MPKVSGEGVKLSKKLLSASLPAFFQDHLIKSLMQEREKVKSAERMCVNCLFEKMKRERAHRCGYLSIRDSLKNDGFWNVQG